MGIAVLNKDTKIRLKACAQAIRPYHITKNFLLFIPILVGHQYFNLVSLKNSLLGFLVFCLLASSTYLINDLVDIETDRQHPHKKKRPFAAGNLSPNVAIILGPCLGLAGLSFSFYLPFSFTVVAVSYYALTFIYSFFIKKIKWMDIILLAIFYSIRVFAGMTLVKKGFSLWLIIFISLLFFSLALLKRCAELYTNQLENRIFLLGRAYQAGDYRTLFLLGYLSAYLSILVFIFYIHSEKVRLLYSNPLLLWLICPCLFIWLTRIWRLAQEGALHDDPVIFTVKDRFSWMILGLIAGISLLAI